MFAANVGDLELRGQIIADLEGRLDAAERALEDAHREIAGMRQTRVWRAGERMWRLKSRVRRTAG
jgi:hypothetical protein